MSVECGRSCRPHWLWTKCRSEGAVRNQMIEFKFSDKLKERISRAVLSACIVDPSPIEKILDEILSRVWPRQSPAMKKLWLSVYAGTLRVVPDAKETRQTRDTAQLLTDIAERRVRELPQSMEQARAVSEMIMSLISRVTQRLSWPLTSEQRHQHC